MYRINLFIVDSDESYLESLTGYILNNYSYRFQVSTFTKKDRLMREIEESQNIIDVLLINS